MKTRTERCKVGDSFCRVCVKVVSLRLQKKRRLNSIDLIVCLILLLAVWNGWRQGLVVQVCSLAGIVIAIWLAAHYGAGRGVAAA